VLFHEDWGSLIPVRGLAKCLEFMALSKSCADLSWDPGASDWSRAARVDVDFGPGAAFLWDPG
jgi:hypothetical protein